MSYRMLRHIASIVLLAIYLPMVMLSSLHVHHGTIDTDDQCRKCTGHIETLHHHHSDCLYCHFLNLDYHSEADGQLAVPPSTSKKSTAETAVRTDLFHDGVVLLRAPPMR